MGIELPEQVRDQLEDMGEPLREFRGGMLLTLLFWVFGLVGITLGLGFLSYGIMLVFNVVELPRGASEETHHAPFKLGGAFLLAGVAMLWRGWTKKGLHVYVLRKGLAKVQGREVRAILWRDVAAVLRVVDTKTSASLVHGAYRLTIIPKEGEPLEFNEDLNGLRELREQVERHTLKHLLPAALEKLRAGKSIECGVLTVSREGLHHDKTIVPWNTYQEAEAAKGKLTVLAKTARKPVIRVSINDVPNYHLLLALADKLSNRGQ